MRPFTFSHPRHRLCALAVAAATVVAGLAWLAIGVDTGAPTAPNPAAASAAPTVPAVRAADLATIASARAEVEARPHSARRPALGPPEPPSVGLPAWAPRLANQGAYRAPVPRGAP